MSGEPNKVLKREDLEALSESDLVVLHAQLSKRCEHLEQKLAREEIMKSLARNRAVRVAGDSLGGARLDLRIEKLFDSLRENRKPWPIEESVRVVDGVVGRLVARRIWLGIVGLLTIIPALASLVLLARQNENMIEKIQIEELADFRQRRTELTDVLHSQIEQLVNENGQQVSRILPTYHRRLRAESFGTIIALEKQRWTEEEREALPPIRFVDLRSGNFSGLALGNTIGVEKGASKDDFTRLRLDGSDMSQVVLINGKLDGSSFRNVQAEGIQIVSASAKGVDFTGMRAQNAQFEYRGKTQDAFEIVDCNFRDADLTGSSWLLCYVANCAFVGSKMADQKFELSYFLNCDFSKADLGDSPDFTGASLHNCIVTDAQASALTLPSYCYIEPSREAGFQIVMTDIEKQNAWHAENQKILEAKAAEELEQLQRDGLIPETE